MALNFAEKFGKTDTAPAAANAQRPKAQFWLNVGFTAEGEGKEGEDVFVSLAQGIPLDTLEKLPTNSSNRDYNALQAARNDLLEQLMEHAKKSLKPGEATTIQLEVQVRHVKAEAEEIPVSQNKFARELAFG